MHVFRVWHRWPHKLLAKNNLFVNTKFYSLLEQMLLDSYPDLANKHSDSVESVYLDIPYQKSIPLKVSRVTI